jgi:type IV secretion system protein VirB10
MTDKIDALSIIEEQRRNVNSTLERSKVGGASRGGKGLLVSVIIIVIIMAAGIGALWYYKKNNGGDANKAVEQAVVEIKKKVGEMKDRTVGAVDAVQAENNPNEEPDNAAGTTAAPVQRTGYQAYDNSAEHEPTPEELAKQRKLQGGLTGSGQQDDSAGGDSGAGSNISTVTGKEKEGAERYDGLQLTTTKARKMPDRDLLLTAGSYIDCALGMALDTTVAGQIVCYTTSDVWSASGRVKLIPRHTKVTGMRDTSLAMGAKRIFAVWSRLETTDGVYVDVGSPATGSAGQGGMGGYVDSHWGDRFGNAILLSFIEDAISAAFESNKQSSNQITLSTTESTTNSLANEVIKKSLDIPPTLKKNQGERVGIFVARDIDFSDVYGVVSK